MSRLAAVLAPLVIVAWFLWPLVPFDSSPGDVIRALVTAYALFFLSRGLASLVASRVAAHLALVFLFAFVLGFSVSIGLTLAGLDGGPLGPAAAGSLLDALWCTVAAAILAAFDQEG